MNVFVTGSSGFIGRNLVEKFANTYRLLTPNHKELELIDSQAVDKFFKKNRVDVVVHLANRGGSQKEAKVDNILSYNLRIFFNIVRNQNRYRKMIFVGSGSEYGKQRAITDVKESDFDKRVPEDDFGFYKYITGCHIERSKNIVNARVFGIYGKYEDWQFRFISNSVCRALYKMPIVIVNNCYFDYLYIDDFLTILDYFISHNMKDRTYNIGTGQKVRLDYIAKKIVNLTGENVPIIVKNKQLGNEYTCDNSRLKNEIKNLQFTPLDKALIELIGWYKQNIKMIDKRLLDLKRVDIWNGSRYNLR